jgi:hypothetical protein
MTVEGVRLRSDGFSGFFHGQAARPLEGGTAERVRYSG